MYVLTPKQSAALSSGFVVKLAVPAPPGDFNPFQYLYREMPEMREFITNVMFTSLVTSLDTGEILKEWSEKEYCAEVQAIVFELVPSKVLGECKTVWASRVD